MTCTNEPIFETMLLCKPGEMLLKSKPVRTAFARRFIHNVKDALSGELMPVQPVIRRDQGVVTVKTNVPDAVNLIRRVFGITSVSTVSRTIQSELSDITRTGTMFFQEAVSGKRFAVRCHRSGKTPFQSMDVAKTLGAALLPGAKGVDLSHPEIVCRIDIHDQCVTYYSDSVKAYGGLPIGSQGKAVALISGGIDSPVAAWYGLKRGLEIHYLFCSLGGPLQLWGPKSAARHLAHNWSYGYKPGLYVADFNPLLREFGRVDHRYRNILLKRYFLRAADALAETLGADAIVTGESLGQVSSQTLSNLNTINRVTQRLVLRPLTGMDKTEVMAVAAEIGTLGISESVPEFCNVAVKKPKTRSCVDDLEILENDIDTHIANKACREWDTYDLRTMPRPDSHQNLDMSHKPVGAWLIWIHRSDSDRKPPGETDQTVDMLELSAFFKTFGRPGIVLFACPHGTISRDAAQIARQKGMDAYVFRPE